jgi:hypothetical protein
MVHIASNTILVWQKNMDLGFFYEKWYSLLLSWCCKPTSILLYSHSLKHDYGAIFAKDNYAIKMVLKIRD